MMLLKIVQVLFIISLVGCSGGLLPNNLSETNKRSVTPDSGLCVSDDCTSTDNQTCTGANCDNLDSTGAPTSGGGVAGLAYNYPGDVGISSDPAVILADDFESYDSISDTSSKWDESYHDVSIAKGPGQGYSGSQSLQFSIPQSNEEISNTIIKRLDETTDILYLRYYSKYQSNFDALGSSHNSGMISASYYIDGYQATSGIPADGYNKFLVSYENGRFEASTANPGFLNVYVYYPDQRSRWGDHFYPDGVVLPNSSTPGDFGSSFVPMDNVIPALDTWQCYELMVRANTVGSRDGRISFWLDGKLTGDFPNLRLRDTNDLRIDRVSLEFHIKQNSSGATKKWYDNVVVATSYIGPMR